MFIENNGKRRKGFVLGYYGPGPELVLWSPRKQNPDDSFVLKDK